MFRSALSLEVDDAEWLRAQILDAILTADAEEAESSAHGRRYVVHFHVSTDVGTAIVRTAWRGFSAAHLMLHPVTDPIPLLSTVALTEDLAEPALRRGEVGTVVEAWEPGVYEVEFSDRDGKAYAFAALRADQLLVLHFEPASQA